MAPVVSLCFPATNASPPPPAPAPSPVAFVQITSPCKHVARPAALTVTIQEGGGGHWREALAGGRRRQRGGGDVPLWLSAHPGWVCGLNSIPARLSRAMERAAEAARPGDLLYFSSLPTDQLAPLIKQKDEDQRSLLHIAVGSGNLGLVQFFADHGCKVLDADEEVRTVLRRRGVDQDEC